MSPDLIVSLLFTKIEDYSSVSFFISYLELVVKHVNKFTFVKIKVTGITRIIQRLDLPQ